MCRKRVLTLGVLTMVLGSAASGQELTVRGQVRLTGNSSAENHHHNSHVLIWLTPPRDSFVNPPSSSRGRLRLIQKDKKFEPHLLVVQAGSVVEFPNRDPFFHSVFSLFEGKRFDLGLYEAGSSRSVHFDRPGISYIFCNIHPQMSAVVIALKTPYYAISDPSGAFSIQNVPPGKYQLQVWNEGSTADVLKALTRQITVSEKTTSLAAIHILENASLLPHKNKYGREYDLSGYDPLYQQQQP
jgi:hypothetical protein